MILVGQIASDDGTSRKEEVEVTPQGWEVRHRIYCCRADAYLSEQPAVIPVEVGHHGRVIGEVCYLRQADRGLFAVLDADDEELGYVEPPWYLSAELEGVWDGVSYNNVRLDALAVVRSSATVWKAAAIPVTGTLEEAHLYWDNPYRAMLKEAAAYSMARRFRSWEPHRIGVDAPVGRTRPLPPIERRPDAGRSTMGGIRYVGGGEILAVR